MVKTMEITAMEELVKADPDKVGEILSAWAREETTASGAKS